MQLVLYTAAFIVIFGATAIETGPVAGWPEPVREIAYPSKADNTQQPALVYTPGGNTAAPLLVALHTWSADYKQAMSVPYVQWCIDKKWNFVHPNFRGPNNNPEACGSERAVADILSAVDYMRETTRVDESRIYLVGVSGGGMAALLMAGRAPEVWAGVSAWVPITDLAAWFKERSAPDDPHRRLWEDMLGVLGGDPATNADAAQRARLRSPITYLERARGLPIDINAGIHDGHTGSVPVSHALNAFNVLAGDASRISGADIEFIRLNRRVPVQLQFRGDDLLYPNNKVLFRRESNNARITIFEGGHEILYEAALSWLEAQQKVP